MQSGARPKGERQESQRDMGAMKGLLVPGVTAAAALAAAMSGAPPAAAEDRTFVVSWWGYNGEKMQANIIEPFRKICGCDIVFETGNNADRLNKLKMRDGKGVDVIYLTESYSQLGIEQGLFQPVDRSKIPNLADLYDIARAPQGKYGPAYTIGRIGIVYDSAKVDPPVTSWDDLWRSDLEASLALADITTTAGPLMIIQAGKHAGVDAYENADKAFEALGSLKANVAKNYQTGSELVSLMSTGEVKVALAQDFTLASMQAAVPSVKWADLADGDIATLNTVNIPKGSENVELAHQFINFVLSRQVQQAEAEQGVDAPVSTKVVLKPDQARLWTYGAAMIGKLRRIDYSKLGAVRSDWIDRWSELFGM